MALKLNNGNILLNNAEQIDLNSQLIAKHWDVDRVLADFGINILGTLTEPPTDQDPPLIGQEYGDAYLVGAEAPYETWIWTRPNFNIGETEPYWLNIGTLAIPGEQGPQGPKGDQGAPGENSQWYVGTDPLTVANPHPNDCFLQSQTGMVYQYLPYGSVYAWTEKAKLTGPQGLTGPRGAQGPVGPQGPQGPKGDTGDVGGFINIVGRVNSSTELPDPTEIQNLTQAYLVGASNELYIQVGDTSATATWNNMGPLNVGTLVSVNGIYQNVWNADTKLNKETYAGTKKVYVVDNQYNTLTLTENATASTIPQRDSSGHLSVPATATVPAGKAVSTTYVQNYALPKSGRNTTLANKLAVYGTSYHSSGNPTDQMFEVAETPAISAIVRYTPQGTVQTAEPADGNDAVPYYILEDTVDAVEEQVGTAIMQALDTVSDWVTVPSSAFTLFTQGAPTGTTITPWNLTVRVNPKTRLISVNGRVQVKTTSAWTTTPGFYFNLTTMKNQGYIDQIKYDTHGGVMVTLLTSGTNATPEPEEAYIQLTNSYFRVLSFESLSNRRTAGTRTYYLSHTFPY